MTEFPKPIDELHAELQAERVELVVARLTELASLLPGVAARVAAYEISARELTMFVNRMYRITDLLGAVSAYQDKNPGPASNGTGRQTRAPAEDTDDCTDRTPRTCHDRD